MMKDDWLQKAKKLHRHCLNKREEGNGGKKVTTQEATTLNELQHAIGSHHGIHLVTYTQAKESLYEMFEMVKSGLKNDLLS